jgi:hypothetical protein
MKKRYIIGLILCCLMILPLVGCSSKKDDTDTAKVTPKTPIQLLADRVNASDSKNSQQDTDISDLATRITNEIAAVSTYNDAPIIARIVTLENANTSGLSDALGRITLLESYIVRITALEDVNTSTRLSIIETQLNISKATATPTPTPTPNTCVVQKPNAIFPPSGGMSINISENGSTVNFEWNNCVNADHYEFYLSMDSSNMGSSKNISSPLHVYRCPVTSNNTFYYWKIVSVSVCNQTAQDAWWFKTQ